MLGCPICDQTRWRWYQLIRSAVLVRCAGCGLIATASHLRRRDSLSSLYETTAEDLAEYQKDYLPARLFTFRREIGRLKKFRETGRLLEIGCGFGYFLDLAVQAGWRAEGIEIGTHAASVARARGHVIHEGELGDLDIPPDSMDAVYLWDVIEHLPDPLTTLAECKRILRPGGQLVLRTPDARALSLSLNPLRIAYQQLAYPANTPEHIFHFSPDHLRAMAERAGFMWVEQNEAADRREAPDSAKLQIVRWIRRLLLDFAFRMRWPYEFILVMAKP